MHYLLIPYAFFMLLYMFFLSGNDSKTGSAGIAFVLFVSIVTLGLALSIQPLSGDPLRYAMVFLRFQSYSLSEIFTYQTGEYLYRLLNWIVGQMTDNPHMLFLIIYTIFIVTFHLALKRIYSSSIEKHIVFSLYILYPYFLFYVVNGKRQGLGLAFVLLSISYLLKNKNYTSIIILFVATLFHSGMFLVLPLILIFLYFKNTRLLQVSSIILIISIISSILGFNEILAEPFENLLEGERRYQAYFSGKFSNINYKTGFRVDFAIFSFIPIFLYLYLKKSIPINKIQNVKYWLALYMLLNSIYHVFSFVTFNDRFAAFSWFILPIVCYEIVRSVNKKYASIYIYTVLSLNVFFLQTYTGKIFLSLEIF